MEPNDKTPPGSPFSTNSNDPSPSTDFTRHTAQNYGTTQTHPPPLPKLSHPEPGSFYDELSHDMQIVAKFGYAVWFQMKSELRSSARIDATNAIDRKQQTHAPVEVTQSIYVPEGGFEETADTKAFRGYRDPNSAERFEEPEGDMLDGDGGERPSLSWIEPLIAARGDVQFADEFRKAPKTRQMEMTRDSQAQKWKAGAGRLRIKARPAKKHPRVKKRTGGDDEVLGDLLSSFALGSDEPKEPVDLGAELEKMQLDGAKGDESFQEALTNVAGEQQPTHQSTDKNSVHARLGRMLQSMDRSARIQAKRQARKQAKVEKQEQQPAAQKKSKAAKSADKYVGKMRRQADFDIIATRWPTDWLATYFHDTNNTNGRNVIKQSGMDPVFVKEFVTLSALAPPQYVAKLLSEECHKPRPSPAKENFVGPKKMKIRDIRAVVERLYYGGIVPNGTDQGGGGANTTEPAEEDGDMLVE
ncbi:hypothetical protein MBLNU230_g4911t1 [Neophaeotheca triangularis]